MESIATTVLKDKDGREFTLDPETWMHIQEFHPEFTEIGLLEVALLKPSWIVRSSWDRESILYYRRVRPHRFHVVVAQIREKKIKTALTTETVKEGDILWPKPNPMR